MTQSKGILRHIGPGLITAAVVLGPGSIVASSRAGAEAGYSLVWVLLLACILMAVFTAMGARLGCALRVTPLTYVAERAGRPVAVLIGLSAFLVTAGFQFGNNIGVSVGLGAVTGWPMWIWPPFFTALSLAFFFLARDLYRWFERLIIALIALMIVCFMTNLFWTGVAPGNFARGLVPNVFTPRELLIAGAMFATTFSAVAAFYQAYLVREKGWRQENIHTAIGDARAGIATLGIIALVIMTGAAQVLHGKEGDFASVGALANQLRGPLGNLALIVYGIGLAAASFSSFIANALIGGAMLADGLGMACRVGDRPTRWFTACVMLIGCGVAQAIFLAGQGSTTSLLVAQSATLIAAPVCAILLYALTTSRNVMGALRNRWPTLAAGALGLLVMAWLFYFTAMSIVERVTG